MLEVTFSIMQLMLKIKSNAIHKQTHQQHKIIIKNGVIFDPSFRKLYFKSTLK